MIRETEALREVFDAMEEAFTATGVDFYLIGAQAKDVWYEKGGKLSRQTNDVDFTALIGNIDDYQRVRDYLKEHKNFRETKTNSFVLLTAKGSLVDILPFGEIEIDRSVTLKGEGLTSINVNGFREVYNSGTEEEQTQTGHHFKVASLPAIVLLKLISYDDRPEKRQKDPLDISGIIEHYIALQADIVFNNHSDIFLIEDYDTDMEQISASVIGREIKKIAAENADLLERLIIILTNHIGQAENSTFIKAMIGKSEKTIENKLKLLTRMVQSLKDK